MNKITLALVFALALSVPAFPKGSKGKSTSKTEHVKGYTKKNGTVVAPHDRTSPNGTETDNWSTKGNVNPETGKKGTKTPKK
jgi:hypothetical protein